MVQGAGHGHHRVDSNLNVGYVRYRAAWWALHTKTTLSSSLHANAPPHAIWVVLQSSIDHIHAICLETLAGSNSFAKKLAYRQVVIIIFVHSEGQELTNKEDILFIACDSSVIIL